MNRRACHMRHSLSKTFSKGFTVVELMVALLVTGILLSVLFVPLEDLYTSNSQALKSIVQTGNVRSTLRAIESDVSLAISFHDTNSTIVTDPSGSNNNTSSPTQWSWTGSSSTSRVLITSNYATTKLPETDTDGTRKLVYQDDCNTPIINATVYFVRDGSLYRRTLANTDTPVCSDTMAQKTTCAPGVTTGVCASAPRDAKLLENVTKFTVDYYSTPSSTSIVTNQYDPQNPSAPTNSQTIVITLTAGTGADEETGTIRITRLNGTTL